ncbi:GumC family protein [Candidatus Laterigemmans baculatus]|uniref:GumC family protein n=1 Tax=Candidatus Laterigemmans baculatus TaxID=2770505 RepID=UPI0013DBA305|nr:polysaccharide biosynthesis tyrosine autokinase [Candidatus Laterigemmans baculatus]
MSLGSEAVHTAVGLARVVWQRRVAMLGCLLAAAALGGLYYLSATPIYQATAQMLVERVGENLLGASTAAELDNQSLIANQEALLTQPLVLERAAERLAGSSEETQIDMQGVPRHRWPEVLRNNLSVSSVNRTNLIGLNYRSKDPEAAVVVLQAVMDAYLDFVEEHHQSNSHSLLATLERVRGEVEEKLAQAQEQLLETRRRVRSLGLEQGGETVHPAVQRVIQLNDHLVGIQEQRIELEAALAALQQAILDGGDLREYLTLVQPEVGTQMMNNVLGLGATQTQTAAALERHLLDIRARLAGMREHYGETHPERLQLEREIVQAEQYLEAVQAGGSGPTGQLRREQLGPMLLSMLKEKLAKTRLYERELERELAASEQEAVELSDGLSELTIAQRELDRHTRLHETLLTQMAGLDIGRNRAGLTVSVTGEPTASPTPVSPRLSLIAAMVLFVGGGLGLVIAYVSDLMDDRFRSPDELERQLRLPLLSVVRRMEAGEREGAAAVLVHARPNAVETEPFRTLRTSLLIAGGDERRIGITSTQPGDGKTTVASNLAASLAQSGRRVLVIDGDLRKPGLSNLFKVRDREGLSTILCMSEPIAQAAPPRVVASEIPGLSLIPCGPKPLDPSELLARMRMAELLAWAEQHFDMVIVDCPPALVASDALIVGRLVDQMMLVVRPDQNPRRMVIRAIEALRSVQTPLRGIIANNVSNRSENHYYGYGYGHYGYGEDEAELQAVPAEEFAVGVPGMPHSPLPHSPLPNSPLPGAPSVAGPGPGVPVTPHAPAAPASFFAPPAPHFEPAPTSADSSPEEPAPERRTQPRRRRSPSSQTAA